MADKGEHNSEPRAHGERLFWEKKRRESMCPHPSITEQRTPSGKSTYTCSLCHMKTDNLAAFGR
jgi:hypothetical protein